MEELAGYQYVLIIGAGILAGAINTLAGNGSAITLAIFTEMLGLPGNVANGTNRIGALFQCTAGSYVFFKNGMLNLSRAKLNLALTCIGALFGVGVAVWISNEQFMVIYKYLMLGVFAILLIRPKRWLAETDEKASISPWLAVPLFLGLGFYGGFIQMGMGIFYLAAMVLISRYSIIEGNALKTFVVGLYTTFVLAIFHWKGLVDWDLGLIMAVGQSIGGYYTASFASKYPKAGSVAYVVLLIIVVIALYSLFFRS